MVHKIKLEDIKLMMCKEDTYYDFKEKHQIKPEDLLKDILSLANCQHKGDRYIIYGVSEEDNRFIIKGIEYDEKRRNLVQINQVLDSKCFAYERVPTINLETLITEDKHEIDILIIKDEKFKPYYLAKDFKNIKSQKIFTRHHDKNSEASYSEIKYMWKEQLGLTGNVKEKFKNLLKNITQWEYTNNSFVNTAFPEYKIIIDNKRICPGKDAFMLFYDSYTDYVCTSKFIVKNTEIYSCAYTIFEDIAQFPSPKTAFSSHLYNNQTYGFYYYIKDSYEYLLFNLCQHHKLTFNETGSEFPHLLIENEDELDSFRYFLNNITNFDELNIKDNNLIELPNNYSQNLNIDSLEKYVKLYGSFKNWRNKELS